MRAIVADRLGDPSVLCVKDVPMPWPGPREVTVQVAAAGVNFPDILTLAGTYQHKQEVPFIPGIEGAGTIHAVGSDVRRWKPGDRVIFGVRPGAFAEYARVSRPEAMVRLPSGWSEIEGAGYRVAARTAYHALVHRAATKKGDVVLVHGASGGVGLAAVQCAKHLGARVIATGGSDARLEIVKRHGGADEVVNYHTTDFVAAVKALTDGKGATVVYDPVGGEVLEKSMRAAAYGARLLIVGFTSGGPSRILSNHALIKGLTIHGVRAGETIARIAPELGRDYIEVLPKLAEQGVMRPHISHCFPMERVADAFRVLINREVVGKAVITMA
jgi:NADPH2:quinone reductase